AWESRQPDLPLRSADEALVLASIVEKETALPAERARIAGVFISRLRKGMRLQTDPTVIYGLGEAYDGDIRRRDLTTDTPYNTYTRAGLPPSPIALPGRESIQAAVQPQETGELYFVATGLGDGSHTFSKTLAEHNAAVARYLARLRATPAVPK
ncbi:MAG: endolytic transglycosylase MltG, partial [Steroidobacteraceae bacterium]|nr:endolytic transglycosylase MltG [Steroidobacteraceae bacterium]